MNWPRILLVIVATFCAGTVGMYLLNPFGVPSWDPRGRVLGVIPYRAPSMSMHPTIPMGSIVVACTAAYLRDKPRSGDIIVFWAPPDFDVVYLKRIVAVGGDTVEFRGSDLLLNGVKQQEPYVDPQSKYPEHLIFSVPKEMVFVAGDNRLHSLDSRHLGPVPEASIVGRVCART